MVIRNVTVNDCTPQTIVIGRRGTYDTMQIAFDLTNLVQTYGSGTAVLAVKRSQDESAYPAVTSQADNTLTWTVSDTDTAYVGAGECQLMWYVDGGLAKTIIYPMVVMRDILQTAEEPPDAYQTWVDDLIAKGEETLHNAQAAAQSASDASTAKDDAVTAKEAAEEAQEKAETAVTHYPKIENNYWMVWDVDSQSYVSTGIQAEGEDGYSPEISITTITGGHRVTITDKDHPQGQSFDVMDGQGGGGTSDYTALTNKPQINGHTLSGNQTAAQLGLATQSDIPTVPVQSVNGKTGAVNLTSGDIAYDESATYQAGSVGAELSDLNRQLNDKQDAPATAGTAGQVLSLDDQLHPVWADQTGGSSEDAAPVIINTASGDVARFDDGADNRQIRKIVGTIVPVQAGTGDPSPDNVRPISGWTGANIEQRGKNLFGGESLKTALLSAFTTSSASGNDVTYKYEASDNGKKIFSKFKPNTQYTLVSSYGGTGHTNLAFYYTDGTSTPVANTVVTSIAGKTIDYIGVYPANFSTITMHCDECGLFEGVVTTDDFVPYTSATLPINWQSEAGIIYGGTVTLNEDGSADVVVDKKILTITGYDSYNWDIYNTNKFSAYISSSANNVISGGLQNSNYFAFDGATSNPSNLHFGITGVGSYVYIRFRYDALENSVENWKNWLKSKSDADNPLQITIKLRTPETFHFDNIGQLYTYFGANNVWIDTGAITECDYPADTKLYIDGITAPDEDMIANDVIASGKYFVVNNQLYLSTAAIAKGAQIIPGTNCTATNLAEALNAINA